MKRNFNHKKATQMLNFFALSEGGAINKMKSLKLIWLADRLHLRLYGRSISNDTYVAMKLGPVASGVKDIAESSSFCADNEKTYGQEYIRLKGDDKYSLESIAPLEEKVFSKTDLVALKKVYDEFGSKDEYELSEISHLYPEWRRHEHEFLNETATRCDMRYEDFFENPEVEIDNPLFNESRERLQVNKEMFFSPYSKPHQEEATPY